MKKIVSISTIASSFLFANVVDLRFFYQDYMDFGQNKGRYTAGTQGVSIKEKSNSIYGNYTDKGQYYDIIMPDFIGPTHSGLNKTFIGGSYVVSAEHVFANSYDNTYIGPEYNYKYQSRQSLGLDRTYARYDKFITSGEKAKLLEVTPEKPLDTTRYTHIWRSGNGRMYYLDNNNSILMRGAYSITGGAVEFTGFNSDGRINFGRDGVYFSNMTSTNDSGSPLWAWDSYEREWVAIGFLSSGNMNDYTNAVTHSWSDFEKFIKANTNPTITLNGATASWDGGNLLVNGSTFFTVKDKDIIFKGGGNLDFGSSAINQGIGGIFFDANQTYTISGTSSWRGAGLHIEEGTIVHWGIDGVSGDGLHKVGKGTLHITKSNSGWLNLGDGVVMLDTESNAFDHYVLVSGRATLKLVENKANALNADKLNFSERGGILDLNGNNLTFQKIRASDIGARITNSSQNKSTITLTNANTDLYLYHGQIGDNIDIISDAVSENNLLGFDGSINNPNGSLTHKKGALLFQGHPYIHAYFDFNDTDPNTNAQKMDKMAYYAIKEMLGQDTYRTPTRLTQDDWEDRIYILKEITTQTGSTFTLGRNATLLSDLTLQGTEAKFGGNIQVYVDRWDGSGANAHNSYQQVLSGGSSQKDDSFFYEGNLTLAESSSLEVSNTLSNPLKFGRFVGKDKNTSALSNTQVHYTLNIDESSGAKIKYMEFYGEDCLKGTNIKALVNGGGKIAVENLKVYQGTSNLSGNLTLSLEYLGQDANPSPSKIVFSNLDSILSLKDNAKISLNNSTLLELQTSNLVWENLHYNTLYPLIISQSPIEDQRNQKDIEFDIPLPSFLTPQTLSSPEQIALVFSRNITQEIMQESSWLEKYASIIISGDTKSSTIAEINNFKNAIKGNEELLSALLETNLEGEKIYHDIYIDSLIQQACNGEIDPLQSYLGGLQNTLKTSSRYGVAILTTSLYNSAHYSYLKNISSVLQNQIAFAKPLSLEQKIRLAKNEFSYLGTRSDYEAPPLFFSQENDKHNHLWVDMHGSFLGGEQSLFYSMGLSGGYDYAFITESNEFLSLGISLHYAFAQYSEDSTQDTSHNLIAGLHTQYIINSNEMLFNFYAGSSIANNTNNSPIPEFNTKRADNFALQAEGYYKYRFELKKNENFYHALKPIVGVGYSYLFVPKENFSDFITISEVSSSNVFLKAGLEYNLATPKTQNIFSLTATYNTTPSYKREIIIGTATPKDYSTEIKPVWLELSYNGSYSLTDSFEIYYTISTQYIPSSRYGISGNLGGSWNF